MSSWNYRVVRAYTPWVQDLGCYYHIHEVYYDDNGEPDSRSTDPMAPYGETPEELLADIKLMLEATMHPVMEVVDNKLKEVDSA